MSEPPKNNLTIARLKYLQNFVSSALSNYNCIVFYCNKIVKKLKTNKNLTCRTFHCQRRSNRGFSRFKEPGPPTVRGLTVSLMRQAMSTSHRPSCKTQLQ